MQTAVLERIEPVAEGVVSLHLRGVDGPLAPWEPGAHVDVALPNWLTRQYSLCGDPADRETYQVAVRHDRLSRGGSEYIHEFLTAGRTIDVSAPRNNFQLAPAPAYLFIAGGIGITPIAPMLTAAVVSGASATLLYVGRSPATMPFADELRDVHGDRVRIHATDEHRRPDFAALAAELSDDALVYCCGPGSMLDAVAAAFPADRLHVERFRPVAKQWEPNRAFAVHCARSGRTVEVTEEDSVLDALNHAGLRVSSGCREGVCGSCELTVLKGEPEHRDDIGAAPGRMYACVSRSLSTELTVDL